MVQGLAWQPTGLFTVQNQCFFIQTVGFMGVIGLSNIFAPHAAFDFYHNCQLPILEKVEAMFRQCASSGKDLV
jgi:hypothetical protein